MPTKSDHLLPLRDPHRVTQASKPHPSPEPDFTENIQLKQLWTSVQDVSTQVERVPIPESKLPNLESSKKRLSDSIERLNTAERNSYKLHGTKRWKSHGNLLGQSNVVNQTLLLSGNNNILQPQPPKQPKLSFNLPQRSKTIYVSNDKSLHLSMEKMISTAGYTNHHSKKDDRLPVVELKPFISSTKKEWIPAKSRAWEEDFPTQPSPPLYASRSVEYFHHTGYPDPQKLDTPRPNDGVCAKAFAASGERKTAHPKMKDVAEGTVIQREVSFVPKPEREKTTNEEIKHQGLYNQYPPFSFISRELTEYDIHKQQLMRVYGQRVEKLPPENNMYMNTWQVYKQTASRGDVKQGEQQMHHMENVENNTYLDENIYDYFDRSVTLPSITVKATGNNRIRRTQSTKETSSDRKPNRPGYRLGVVNSLDIMSMCGKPLKIEQSLTNNLKITLEKLKRTKDNSFIQTGNNTNTGSPLKERNHINKMDIVGIPTIGEIMIQEARKSNSYAGSQSAPVKRSKSQKSSRDYNLQSRATTYFYDSGFEGSSNDRKSVSSPTKSLNRNSRMQMHQIITEDVKEGVKQQQQRQKSGLASNSLVSHHGDPTVTPNNEQAEKLDDASSVGDSVDITQSGRSIKNYPPDGDKVPKTDITKEGVHFDLTKKGPSGNVMETKPPKPERIPSKGSLKTNSAKSKEEPTGKDEKKGDAQVTEQPAAVVKETTGGNQSEDNNKQDSKDNVNQIEQPVEEKKEHQQPTEDDDDKNEQPKVKVSDSSDLSKDNVQKTEQPTDDKNLSVDDIQKTEEPPKAKDLSDDNVQKTEEPKETSNDKTPVEVTDSGNKEQKDNEITPENTDNKTLVENSNETEQPNVKAVESSKPSPETDIKTNELPVSINNEPENNVGNVTTESLENSEKSGQTQVSDNINVGKQTNDNSSSLDKDKESPQVDKTVDKEAPADNV